MMSPFGRSLGDTVPVNGEHQGMGPTSPALAGCLGKAEDRGEVTGDCPWCSAKGQTSALRSYAVNFKESLTLCSSPMCLFPLISSPLEDISSSLFSPEGINVCKRKYRLSEFEDPNPTAKRQKKEQSDVHEVCDHLVSTVPPEELANGHKEKKVVEKDVQKTYSEASTSKNEDPVSNVSQTKDYSSGSQGEAEMEALLEDAATQDLIELVPAPLHLFWRNKDNLCWLDSLLVALIHLRAFYEEPCGIVNWTEDSKNCTIRDLCIMYKKTSVYLKTEEQKCKGNIVKIPADVLQKAEQELEAFRLSVFQLLQPKLQCELGQKETPVFALPLYLRTDKWAHSLFQHTGQWEFKCTSCQYTINNSVEKTLTTFTKVTADWHPLKAVHRTECSNCHRKNQRRKLVFQRLSPVLALHFVEGLPRRDVSKYSFDFQGTHYAIKAIIQYSEQLEHFVTWIHQLDGSWLEFDDLKYPSCITHKRFTLRASQLHLVFWEAESKNILQHPEPIPEEDTPVVENGNESTCLQNMTNCGTSDSCIIEALTVNEDKTQAVSSLDSSIGSTTLLNTFEGLSHNDIVTLTLVEVKVDSDGKPLPNPQETAKQPESGDCESSNQQKKTSICQASYLSNHNTVDISSTLLTSEIILPSVVRTSAPPAEVSAQARQSPLLPPKPNVSNVSFLLQRHPSLQSTPFKAPHPVSRPKPDLKFEGNEALPAKPAELFCGFIAKNCPSPILPGGVSKQPSAKIPHSQSAVPLPFSHSGATTAPFQASKVLKSAGKQTSDMSATKLALSSTDALRLKLMKKLKAKKKKLAKLNQLLGKREGESNPRPDSTDLSSPYSVTSSTSVCDSPAYDHFFAELLSPATTSSNLSPDSTGLLEMLTNGQGRETSNSPAENLAVDNANFSASRCSDPPMNNHSSANDDFFDALISGSEVQQSVIVNTDFNALDMFF